MIQAGTTTPNNIYSNIITFSNNHHPSANHPNASHDTTSNNHNNNNNTQTTNFAFTNNLMSFPLTAGVPGFHPQQHPTTQQQQPLSLTYSGVFTMDSRGSGSMLDMEEGVCCGWTNCSLIFSNIDSLSKHVSEMHVKRVSQNDPSSGKCLWKDCPRNGVPFSTKMKLITHLRSHTGERPFPCKECNKKFARQDILAKHAKVHTNAGRRSLRDDRNPTFRITTINTSPAAIPITMRLSSSPMSVNSVTSEEMIYENTTATASPVEAIAQYPAERNVRAFSIYNVEAMEARYGNSNNYSSNSNNNNNNNNNYNNIGATPAAAAAAGPGLPSFSQFDHAVSNLQLSLGSASMHPFGMVGSMNNASLLYNNNNNNNNDSNNYNNINSSSNNSSNSVSNNNSTATPSSLSTSSGSNNVNFMSISSVTISGNQQPPLPSPSRLPPLPHLFNPKPISTFSTTMTNEEKVVLPPLPPHPLFPSIATSTMTSASVPASPSPSTSSSTSSLLSFPSPSNSSTSLAVGGVSSPASSVFSLSSSSSNGSTFITPMQSSMMMELSQQQLHQLHLQQQQELQSSSSPSTTSTTAPTTTVSSHGRARRNTTGSVKGKLKRLESDSEKFRPPAVWTSSGAPVKRSISTNSISSILSPIDQEISSSASSYFSIASPVSAHAFSPDTSTSASISFSGRKRSSSFCLKGVPSTTTRSTDERDAVEGLLGFSSASPQEGYQQSTIAGMRRTSVDSASLSTNDSPSPSIPFSKLYIDAGSPRPSSTPASSSASLNALLNFPTPTTIPNGSGLCNSRSSDSIASTSSNISISEIISPMAPEDSRIAKALPKSVSNPSFQGYDTDSDHEHEGGNFLPSKIRASMSAPDGFERIINQHLPIVANASINPNSGIGGRKRGSEHVSKKPNLDTIAWKDEETAV